MRVALTGGIASGKSTAADELRRHGLVVIDYDQLARDVVAPGTPGLAAVKQAFPNAVAADGALDRGALGRLVFENDTARRRLEGIVHPLVFEAAAQAEAQAGKTGQAVVVHEIPLLVDDMDPAAFDLVIVVDTPAASRAKRLVEGRGMTPGQAGERLAAQVGDQARRAVASVIWDGSGTPADLRAQAGAWADRIASQSAV
jgi:dephospho-CoA kinase